MDQININYDKISITIFELLTTYSSHINKITLYNNELIQTRLNSYNHIFNEYVYHFNKAKYYHLRCAGYMECLVITKSYSVESLCYHKKDLLALSSKNLITAINTFKKLKQDKTLFQNETLRLLGRELDAALIIMTNITSTLKLYNLPC